MQLDEKTPTSSNLQVPYTQSLWNESAQIFIRRETKMYRMIYSDRAGEKTLHTQDCVQSNT